MARAIPVASAATDVQAVTGTVSLVGFCAAAGAAATVVRLRDGTDSSGTVKAVIGLAANGTAAGTLPAVDFTAGVFVDRDGTNSAELVLYLQ
jgi:hypothetical protein